jgi:hypothetical protein
MANISTFNHLNIQTFQQPQHSSMMKIRSVHIKGEGEGEGEGERGTI